MSIASHPVNASDRESVDARLRIALLTYSTKPRGSVVHTLELAEALHALGHEVCVYALSKDGSGFDRPLACRTCLIPAAAAPTDTDALIQQRIQEFVSYLSQQSLHHDIYHAQDCLSANALAQLRQQRQIPHLIRTVHHIEEYRSPYLQACQDRSIREVDRCFCVSDRWQMELQDQYQIQAARVLNGVNLQHFSSQLNGTEPLLKQRWMITGAPIYLTIGGIEPRKNSINLLRAFAEVKQTFPQAQLVIAGGATLFDYQTYQQEFLAVAEQLGVTGDSLRLLDVIPTEELPALYRIADAFVFPSIKEGWGLVLLEAIASGLPVITSQRSPFTEFLTPDQALLVDPLIPSELARAMNAVVQPELAQSLIQQSQSVLSTYTWEASAQTHVQHYQQLLQHSRIPL